MATRSSGEHGRLAELEHSYSVLKRDTGEIRALLEAADEDLAELRLENEALSTKVKNLESDGRQVQCEFARVKSLLADEQSSSRSKQQEIKQLKEERRILLEQDKSSCAQLKDLQQQKEQRDLSICNMEAALQRLQITLEESRQELKMKDETIHIQNWHLMQVGEMREEFTNLIRDLRLRVKDLQSQVELLQEEAARLVKHQFNRNPLSIADEVDLQTSLAVVLESSRREETVDVEETALETSSQSPCGSGGQRLLLRGAPIGIWAMSGVVALATLAPMVNWGCQMLYDLLDYCVSINWVPPV